jgi:predicted pyridoxine 5'-phosphate oxidase superfamily flavin-nucleotide-binding protein
MTVAGRPALGLGILLVALPLVGAEDVRIAAGTVEDQRHSDARMGGLTIELKLTGGALSQVKALRAKVKSARDDLGANLLASAKDEKLADFDEFALDRRPGPSLRLSSPSREASTIDVAGELELFLPSRDPDTTVRIDSFLGRADKPISVPAIKTARVEITPLSVAAYTARQQAGRPKKEDLVAEGKKQGVSEAEIDKMLSLVEAFTSLGGEEPTETSVLLATKDPDGRIMSLDVVGADGAELHANSRSSQGGRESRLVKIDLSSKPPADAALLVTLRTAKSVVTIPLNLKGVALP